MNADCNVLKRQSNVRKERASALLNKAVPEVLDEGVYLVPSSDRANSYKVSHIDTYSCDCPDFIYRCKDKGLYCKHIDAIILFNKLKNKVEMDDFDVEGIMDEKMCPNCKSERIIQKGLRKNKSGAKQKYRCLECGAFFVLDPTKGIKGNARIVCLTLDMYYKGNSLRDIQDTLYKNFGLKLHNETVRRWINRFMARINDYTANLKPQTSERIHIDEQSVQIGKENEWCWNVLDNKTRFLLANQITRARFINDARNIIQKAKPYLSQKPKEIATDKGQFYKKAIRQEFPTHGRLFVPERLRDKPHERVYHMTKKVDNQLIERYHATFRERDKVIRGLKNEKTAEQYIENWKTYYNFIKPHMTFNGLTPSEVAGISIGANRNRWLSLIKLSQ
ncbi:DDE-type integrase/transposase/recombinase [Candidatus Marsarchaeota archaeon]|nr:DDE-type integrase/transposase/recombinase [Candidatus Marsarchaeota archaeon]